MDKVPSLPDEDAVWRSTHQCTANKKDGERCRMPAEPGTFVCRYHGGRSPLTKLRAQERIDEIALEHVNNLHDIALNESYEPRDRIAASKELLNRTGEVRQPNSTSVNVTYNPSEDPVRMEILRQAREAAALEAPRVGRVYEITDAEVIDVKQDE